MKVLQLSKFYPPVRGGIEMTVWELTEALNRRGIYTDVMCANARMFTRRERAPTGYDVLRVGSLGKVLSTSMAPAMPWHLARRRYGYDLVHVHMPDPMAALALSLARPRARLVVHWHSDVVRQRRAMRLYEPLQSWLLESCDAVIATTEAYAEASEALRPWRHKVSVVPIGISDNTHRADPVRVAAVRERYRGRQIVFSLGRMTYYKGFDVLIDAAQSLRPNTVVLIGGTGQLLDEHRSRIARLGLTGRVYMLGELDADEVHDHFAACDLFCISSTQRAEAYGVAMVEAMSMGKPVVATEIPGSGVPWVNVDGVTGANVPTREPARLASQLNRLLADPELLQRLGRAARERYLQRFHVDCMTSRIIDLYQGLDRRSPARVQ